VCSYHTFSPLPIAWRLFSVTLSVSIATAHPLGGVLLYDARTFLFSIKLQRQSSYIVDARKVMFLRALISRNSLF